jgi:pentatricopeptide repeat protein
VSDGLWDHGVVSEPSFGATFAGRAAELDRLWGAFVALDTTGTRVVLIGGEAGIGKTRLVDEFRDRARAGGTLVAAGVCTPAEGGGLPYGPVVGVLRDLSRQLDDATAAAILAPARQGLGLDGATVAPAGATIVSEMGKTHLFEALLGCLKSLAERSRVVIVFEDLHWADSASVEVIDFLARNLDASPLLLIGTFRTDELSHDQSRTFAELGRHRAVSQLDLKGLDRDAIAVLMSGILGQAPEWALLDAVHARCDGNPFFAEELTAARDAKALPSVLRNVIMLRIERLTPAARHLAAVVAVAGGSIDHRLLDAASDLDPELLTAAITETVELHVLTAEDRSRFRFRHALQRDAVDDAILPTERARLHHRLASALTANPELAASGPGYAAVELAEHWWEAAVWPHALTTSIRAADAMAALLAMPEAYAHYERAVSAYDQLPDNEGRRAVDYVDLLLKTADAAYMTGVPQRAVELVHIALANIDTAVDPRRAAAGYAMLGRNAWAIGDADSSFEALQRAAELLPSDPPSVELARVVAEEARNLLLIAHDCEAEARSRDALAIARAVGARAEESHALTTLGACIAEHGDPDAGITLIREALAIAEDLGRPDGLDLAYKILTHVLMQAGRLDEAAQVVFDGIALDERLVGVRLNGAGGNSAEALIRRGRWDEADDLLGRMDERGIGSCVFGPQALRAMLAMRRGRLDEAVVRLDTADELSAGLGTVQVRGWFHLLRAELALEQDDPAQAYEEIERALMVAAGTDDNVYRPEMCAIGLRALADEYDAARARGRRIEVEKFHRLAAALVEQAEHHVVGPEQQGVRPPRSFAQLALCQAEESRLHASEPDLWKCAAERWHEAGEPYHAAYSRWREAEAALVTGGGRGRSRDAAQAAFQTCLDIGAPSLQARVERLAQRARITMTLTDSATTDSRRQSIAEDLGLTAREIEVLAQLALGRTDRQIADELFISKKTASVHVSNILRKLDVANRIDAAEIGQRAGLN